MRIGIFDSGLGGLSVLHCARKMTPEHDYIFYADTEHVPYGEKTVEQVREYVDHIIKFMISKGVDIIIIACNTATSALSMEYRKTFPIPIVGIEPAVKKALDEYGNQEQRVLVAATPITIHGHKLEHLIHNLDHHHKVDLVAAPGLVRFAENGIFSGKEVHEYLSTVLKGYDLEKVGTVVLGCTHFNYFKESFIEIFPHRPHFVDGNEGTVRQAMRLMGYKNIDRNNCSQTFCYTDKENNEFAIECKKDYNQRRGMVTYLFSGKEASIEDMQKIDRCMTQLDKMMMV